MEEEPLVIGGVLNQERFQGEKGQEVAPKSFVSRAPPVIEKDTIIIAVTSPGGVKAQPTEDGWFLSDFYAFNYLLKGLGSSQLWLTATNPRKLIRPGSKHDVHLHGNPYQDRKVVLSHDLLESGELTPVEVVRNTSMIDRFLKEVKTASETAWRHQIPLLLLVFCHGLPDTFILDHGQRAKGLTVTQLKGVIEPGCRVTMYSTACFSGGWVALDLTKSPRTLLNCTMLAAADPDDESNSWPMSRSIGRACGSVFASTIIEALTSATSPLLAESQTSGTDTAPSIQPEDPTPEQTMTYNAFCRSIVDICSDRITRLADYQTFTFSAQNDQWANSWTGRTGIPLGYFENRWNKLRSVPYTGSQEDKDNMDQNPGNSSFGGSIGEIKHGGSGIKDAMTLSRRHHQVKRMAELFLQTCPGDWNGGYGPSLYSSLRRTVEGEPILDDDLDVAEFIAYRWELAALVDYIVQDNKLPLPCDQACIMWDRMVWKTSCIQRKLPVSFGKRRDQAWSNFWYRGLMPTPTPAQGPIFFRPIRYLAAAMAEANLSEEETDKMIDKIFEFMARVRKFHHNRAVQDTHVIGRGRTWVKAVGRKLRRSLSPRKREGRDRSDSQTRIISRHGRLGSASSAAEFLPSMPRPNFGR